MQDMTQEELNAIEPMSREDHWHYQERQTVAQFCNCSLMDLDKMSDSDYTLWRQRAIAFAKTNMAHQQQMQMQQRAMMEQQAILQQMNAGQNGKKLLTPQ